MHRAPNWELHAAGVARRPCCENTVATRCRETGAAAPTLAANNSRDGEFRQVQSENNSRQQYDAVPAHLNTDKTRFQGDRSTLGSVLGDQMVEGEVFTQAGAATMELKGENKRHG